MAKLHSEHIEALTIEDT